MKDLDKEIYNSRICINCKNNDICDHNKFRVLVYKDKTTMRCLEYERNITENENSLKNSPFERDIPELEEIY